MKGFDRLHIKSAVKSHNKFDLSRTHLTTGEFGQIVPLFSEETVPGDKFSVNANYFSRMAPLTKPTYGRFSFRTLAGFVPFYQVADDAEAFIDGKTTWEGDSPKLRYFTVKTLLNYLNSLTSAGSSTNYSFTFLDTSGTRVYRKFNNKGRYVYKIFTALGYSLPESADLQTTGTWVNLAGAFKLNAMPLLCFFKLYNDWMSQSQRYNTSALTAALKKIKHSVQFSGFYPSTGELDTQVLQVLFNNLYVNYENDYFTSAWQNAVYPLATGESLTNVVPPQGRAGHNMFMQSITDDTVLYSQNDTIGGSQYTYLGQRTLDFLKSYDDWVRRNNYSGSRVVQQVYSRFGIKTSDFRDNYAEIINSDVCPVQVGDVTSQSDATGAVLGDYAGKGILNDGKSFSYEAKDFGMLFVFGWFTVTPMNPFGFNRNVLRNQPLDYYHPEFDGIGADAISYMEIYEDPTVDASDLSNSEMVFGFTERYNSYRFGRDQVTGDFRDFKSVGMNVWHTARYLTNLRKSLDMVAQSSSMNTISPTDSEYNRIFNVTTGDVDHFYLTCQFSVSAVRPMLSLNQVPRLGEGDTNVPRNGNTVN